MSIHSLGPICEMIVFLKGIELFCHLVGEHERFALVFSFRTEYGLCMFKPGYWRICTDVRCDRSESLDWFSGEIRVGDFKESFAEPFAPESSLSKTCQSFVRSALGV